MNPPKPIIDGRKKCSRCKEWLDLALFNRDRTRYAGISSDCRKCASLRSRNSKTRPARMRAYSLRMLYGLTVAAYDDMLAAQGGRCAICRASEEDNRGRLHVDHCHASGKVRSLLCRKCNMMLGSSNESESILLGAIEYLRRHR